MLEQINSLIINLIAIQEFSKDIHYTCHGEGFYAKHLLVDKFNFYEDIDLLKECCLLGNGDRPAASKFYLEKAAEIMLNPHTDDDKENFRLLSALIYETLEKIDNIQNLSKADENILGGIAQKLQQYKGLINLQIL